MQLIISKLDENQKKQFPLNRIVPYKDDAEAIEDSNDAVCEAREEPNSRSRSVSPSPDNERPRPQKHNIKFVTSISHFRPRRGKRAARKY